MNKFTKIKKGLAVSLCGSMLFSVKSETKAMDNIKNSTNNTCNCFCNSSDSSFFIQNFFSILTAVVALSAYGLNFINNSLIIKNNNAKEKEIYIKICYFFKILNDKNLLNDAQKDKYRMILNCFRKDIENSEYNFFNKYNFFRYLININSVSSDSKSCLKNMVNALVKEFSEFFTNNNNNTVFTTSENLLKESVYPENVMENTLKYIITLRNDIFNQNGLDNYVKNHQELPDVDEVLR